MTKNTSFGSFRRSERGVSLVEAAVILAVISTLTAVLAPAINGYIEQARQARTREDIQTIGEAIQDFVSDNGELQFLINASNGDDSDSPTRLDANRVELLISDGDIPALGSAVTLETYWTQTLSSGAWVDTISNHLIENKPRELADSRYRNPPDIAVGTPGGNNIDFARSSSGSFNAPYSWRGPYLRGPVDSDPWGNRYAVNVAFLDPAPTASTTGVITAGFSASADYPRLDVFVLSAGPDEEIDTLSGQDGAVPGDDDFIYIVSSNAN